MKLRLALQSISPYISCFICKGYLIDATTVAECLHAFCKSCLVKYLEENNTCPKCDVIIHRSHPLQHIKPDRTLQDIIYKLVPDLQNSEIRREKYFCRIRGIPYPKYLSKSPKDKQLESQLAKCRLDDPSEEQVSIQLEAKNSTFEQLPRKFICCSSRTTVTHLKKLVAKKLFCDLEKYCAVDILCKEEVLGKDHTLKFIYVTRWRFEEPPLKLYYIPKINLLKE